MIHPKMNRVRHVASCLVAATMILGFVTAASPALAQPSDPEEAPIQFESLALAPTLRITNVGWDDNVFFVNEDDDPVGDFMAMFSPAARGWIRLPRLRITGTSEVDFVYFRKLSNIRSVDTNNSARLELPLGRLTPYAGGTWTSARHRRNFEIDAPIRRVHSAWDAGVDFELSSKTSIGVVTRGSRERYEGDTIYLDSDLAQVLGATGRGEGVLFRYAVTPFTRIGVNVHQDRSRFPAIPSRNSDGTSVVAVVELNPLALISGRAEVGVRNRRFVDGSVPPFQGAVARVDLTYTLLGRTRFTVTAQRDLAYSYRLDQRDYLLNGLDLAVTQRLGSIWDVGARAGRFALTYGIGDSLTLGSGDEVSERVNQYGVTAGVRMGNTRVGFQVSHQRRASDFGGRRGYQQTRIASSLEYAF